MYSQSPQQVAWASPPEARAAIRVARAAPAARRVLRILGLLHGEPSSPAAWPGHLPDKAYPSATGPPGPQQGERARAREESAPGPERPPELAGLAGQVAEDGRSEPGQLSPDRELPWGAPPATMERTRLARLVPRARTGSV